MPTPPNQHQTLTLAMTHHQAGRLADAARLYQEIISRDPHHADALRLLGVIAHQQGNHRLAEDLLRQAISINPKIAEYHNDLALALHALGKLDDAIAEYQRTLELKPDLAQAHYNLANTLRAAGRTDEAIASYQLALDLQPNYPEALNNLGMALKDQKLYARAIRALRKALELRPHFAAALTNLGNALQMNGELKEAVEAYQSALRLKADDAQTLNNLGSALQLLGQREPAMAYYKMALTAQPNYPEAWFNVGNALLAIDQPEHAVAAYKNAIILRPGYAEAHVNLGNALKDLGKKDESLDAYRRAAELAPDLAEAHNNLGSLLKDMGQIDAAVEAFRTAIATRTDYAEAWSNLGSALREQGLMPETLQACRRAVELARANPVIHNNLIYAMHFDPAYDPRTIAAELATWNATHAEPLLRDIKPFTTDPERNRPLRVGLVSPDFKSHPIGRFILPLLEAHDKSQILLFCYSDANRMQTARDPLTQRLRAAADSWQDTRRLTDKELATLIRLDRIDVLIDLTMHMQGSRLLTFAQKPAPLQMTYLAYASFTGLQTMDYRLTDPAFDPLPTNPPLLNTQSPLHTERPLHLNSYWCYPAPDNAPDVSPLPAATAGHVTFACLNNFAKASPQALAAWIDILRATPDSRLFLHAAPGSHRDRHRQTLDDAGIHPSRIEFFGFLPFGDYLALHHQIDIVLDPFPYAGGTTSCDALFMGVPLITYNGPYPLTRGGTSLLTQLNLQELIATSIPDYIHRATKLASDIPQLSRLRATLRQRMQSSPLMTPQSFAHNFATTLRSIWNQAPNPLQ